MEIGISLYNTCVSIINDTHTQVTQPYKYSSISFALNRGRNQCFAKGEA